MEVLLGMILLLQVLASIQIMLVHRQMLQQINKQSEKMEVIFTRMQEHVECEEESTIESQHIMTAAGTLEAVPGEITKAAKKKDVQEALINEVLSEVFSYCKCYESSTFLL